jgi:hypothetical protein
MTGSIPKHYYIPNIKLGSGVKVTYLSKKYAQTDLDRRGYGIKVCMLE